MAHNHMMYVGNRCYYLYIAMLRIRWENYKEEKEEKREENII